MRGSKIKKVIIRTPTFYHNLYPHSSHYSARNVHPCALLQSHPRLFASRSHTSPRSPLLDIHGAFVPIPRTPTLRRTHARRCLALTSILLHQGHPSKSAFGIPQLMRPFWCQNTAGKQYVPQAFTKAPVSLLRTFLVFQSFINFCIIIINGVNIELH